MAGLSWIELHVGLPRHRKSIRLGHLLGDERAWAYMAQIWLWCAEECPGGKVEGDDAGMVLEHAAGWRGEPGKLAGAALTAGFLDEVGGGIEVHGWGERAAAHLAKRDRDAERQRKRYERISAKFRGASDGSHAENARRTRGDRADLSGNRNPNPNPNHHPSEDLAGVPPAGDSVENGFQRQAGGLPLRLAPGGEQPLLTLDVGPGAQVATRGRRRKAVGANEAQEQTSGLRRQLSDALVADFEALRRARYAFAGSRDGKALEVLIELAAGEIDEARRRWRWGLSATQERDGGPPWAGRVNTIAELASRTKWNALAAAPALPTPAGQSCKGGEVPNVF